jgi:hypothetical protein
MARAKPKWGFRLGHDFLPETRREVLDHIRDKAEFPISDHGMKELARIIGSFNANRAHEPLKNRPRTRDVIKTLDECAEAWSKGSRQTEEIDDVTRRHLVEAGAPVDLIEASEDGRPADLSILAAHARRKASDLQKKLEDRKEKAESEGLKGVREKGIDYSFTNLVLGLSGFYIKHAGKVPTANYSENSGEAPFVRFVRLCLKNIEPRFLLSHSNSGSLRYRVREILLSASILCPVKRKRCPPGGPLQPTCLFDKEPCPYT